MKKLTGFWKSWFLCILPLFLFTLFLHSQVASANPLTTTIPEVHQHSSTNPQVDTFPKAMNPGDTFTVNAAGFPPDTHLDIYLDSSRLQGYDYSSDYGTFSQTYTAPKSLSLGIHYVKVVDAYNNQAVADILILTPGNHPAIDVLTYLGGHSTPGHFPAEPGYQLIIQGHNWFGRNLTVRLAYAEGNPMGTLLPIEFNGCGQTYCDYNTCPDPNTLPKCELNDIQLGVTVPKNIAPVPGSYFIFVTDNFGTAEAPLQIIPSQPNPQPQPQPNP